MGGSLTPPTAESVRRGPARLVSQQLHLTFLNTPREGTSLVLGGPSTQLGKSADCDYVIDHPTVSRKHARIEQRGDRLVVVDQGSTNGTWLDGTQVTEAVLRPGATLCLGDVELRVEAHPKAEEVAPAQQDRLGDLVGRSAAMREVFTLIQRFAASESTVMLYGETGCGKGAVARSIHEASSRREGPFVVFDCSGVSESLVESELFGHEQGAFTGASRRHRGFLERATGGTLLIDEIDDLSPRLQPKLLRALEERRFNRLGGTSPIRFEARVIAASKKDLWEESRSGRFRQDLFFRLAVLTVAIPPLRDRPEDIPLLVDALAQAPLWASLPEHVCRELREHAWPGNVRELRNLVQRMEVMGSAPEPMKGVRLARAPVDETFTARLDGPYKEAKEALVREFEKAYLERLMQRHGENIARAAREAGVDRSHFYELLARHGMRKR